jgi:hypothetical protein
MSPAGEYKRTLFDRRGPAALGYIRTWWAYSANLPPARGPNFAQDQRNEGSANLSGAFAYINHFLLTPSDPNTR